MTGPLQIDPVQFGAKVGRHMAEFGRDPKSASDRQWLTNHIHEIFNHPDEIRDGTFSGQGNVLPSGSHARGAVWFYAKGQDVVVTDKLGNFVTILKDGIANLSFLSATIVHIRP
jgi:filamentous hemagglutinin